MSDEKGKTESPTIGISLNAQFAAGRTVVFQTYVPQDVMAEGLGVILEKLNGVADREEAFYAQEQARQQLKVEERASENMARRLSEVESRIQDKASDGKRIQRLSGNEEKEKKQAYDTLEEGKRRVAECKAHLADLIKRAGRDGASSPTDR